MILTDHCIWYILTTKALIDLGKWIINSIFEAISNQDKLKEDTKKEVEEASCWDLPDGKTFGSEY